MHAKDYALSGVGWPYWRNYAPVVGDALDVRTVAGFMPFLGDVLDVMDAGIAVNRGDYAEAGMTAGMLFLPNFIEKPIKGLVRRHNLNVFKKALEDPTSVSTAPWNLTGTDLAATHRDKLYYRKLSREIELLGEHNRLAEQFNTPRSIEFNADANRRYDFTNPLTFALSSKQATVPSSGELIYSPAYPDALLEYTTTGIPVLTSSADNFMLEVSNYESALNGLLGDDGVVFGSTSLYGKMDIPGTPGDTEILTTLRRLRAVENKLGTRTTHLGFAHTGSSSKAINGSVDIDVIEEDNFGRATGTLAHQLYSYLHPLEFNDLHRRNAFKRGKNAFDVPLPISSEALLLEAKLNPDAMFMLSMGDAIKSYKGKHLQRYLTFLDSHKLDDVIKRLEEIGVSIIGRNFKTAKQLFPFMRFDDVESNKEFLRKLNLPERYANNPKAMEAIVEKYNLEEISTRRANPTKEFGLEAVGPTNYSPNGYYGSGMGGNAVAGAPLGGGRDYGDFLFALQPDRTNLNIKSPLEYLNSMERELYSSTISLEDLKKIKKIIPKFNGKTMKDLSNYITLLDPKVASKITLEISDATGMKYYRGNAIWTSHMPYTGLLDSNANYGVYFDRSDRGNVVELSGAIKKHGQNKDYFLLRIPVAEAELTLKEMFRDTPEMNLVIDQYLGYIQEDKLTAAKLNKLLDDLKRIQSDLHKYDRSRNILWDKRRELRKNKENLATSLYATTSAAMATALGTILYRNSLKNKEEKRKQLLLQFVEEDLE